MLKIRAVMIYNRKGIGLSLILLVIETLQIAIAKLTYPLNPLTRISTGLLSLSLLSGKPATNYTIARSVQAFQTVHGILQMI
jgi:hypothetical protein